ncbi:MAG: ATP-binding protein [Candidatus ainarchaeum sp.]|nr:ATP-binding protein [Candidatus ainarchaeum sp.]
MLSLLKLKLPLIITGVRRCGKSSLMVLIRDELKLSKGSCLFVDFSDERLIGFEHSDFQKIEDFLIENKYSEKCFLFIDEVQEAEHWEKWVNRLKEKHPIIITGSNSKLLSKEIASTLTGRSINLHLEPFSFKEFLFAKKIKTENYLLDAKKQALIRRAFLEYYKTGGFPKMVLSGDETILRELYENILYRDVIARLGANLEKPVKELSSYFLSNPSGKISSRKAGELMGITNLLSVKKVLNAFENSFLFFFLPKFDFSIKKQIQNPRKLYCIDNGLITALGFRFSDNEGKMLENLVAIELKRRSKDIYYSSETKECDFVIKQGNQIVEAIQATWKLTPENREREMAGLIETMNKFKLKKGIILTNDQEEKIAVSGKKITIMPTWKWMLENGPRD